MIEAHASADTDTFDIEGSEDEAEHEPVGFLQWCWPAVVGILLAIVADQLRAQIDTLWGDVGDRLVFPWVQLAGRPELGLGDTGGLASAILRLQFPIAGLYASFNLSRGHRLAITLAQIAFVFGIAAFVLWLLTKPGASHGL